MADRLGRGVGLYGSDLDHAGRRRAFADGEVPVAVYGLGKMGLPVAVTFADRGGTVVGVDIDESVARAVDDGECPVTGEPGLPGALARAVDRGDLSATTDGAAAARDAHVHVLLVPTLLDEDDRPDLTSLEAAVEDVAAGLTPGDVVFVESTVPPGTCADVVKPHLAAVSGLDPGEFGVACCPERTSSGRALRDIRRAYPRVVGGTDPEATRVAEAVYDVVTENDVIAVADAATAAAVKVFEGVYRDVNIALANELATLAADLGVDVRAAIDAANTQPYCDLHDPGPGVGGHCIPYYPYFLIDRADSGTPLLETARAVNDGMPDHVARTVERALSAAGTPVAEATVVVLGVTYRAGVDETRATPARGVVDALSAAGASVYAVDPVCSDLSSFDATPLALSDLPSADPDAVVLLTAHEAFDDVPWDRLGDPVVVDTRDALGSVPVTNAVTLARDVPGTD